MINTFDKIYPHSFLLKIIVHNSHKVQPRYVDSDYHYTTIRHVHLLFLQVAVIQTNIKHIAVSFTFDSNATHCVPVPDESSKFTIYIPESCRIISLETTLYLI